MEQLLEWMEIIEDIRQQSKVRHSLKEDISLFSRAVRGHWLVNESINPTDVLGRIE